MVKVETKATTVIELMVRPENEVRTKPLARRTLRVRIARATG